MYSNTSEKLRTVHNLQSESETLSGSLGYLESMRSVEEIVAESRRKRTAKDIAIRMQFKDLGSIQKTKEMSNNSKLKCLKWCKMTTNAILILVCVGALSERVYECISR